MTGSKWLDLNQILQRVPLSRNTVYGALLDGSLAGRKIGNKWVVSEAALEEWLEPETDRADETAPVGSSESVTYPLREEVSHHDTRPRPISAVSHE